jgi:hypothetical protein
MVTIIGQFNPWGSLKTGTTPTFSHMEQVESSWQEQIELGVIEVCRVMFCDTTKLLRECLDPNNLIQYLLDLSTAAYLISFAPRLILRHNLLPISHERPLRLMLIQLLCREVQPNRIDTNSRLKFRRRLHLPVEQPLLGKFLEG